jgi:hypothetical protein
MGSVDNRGLCIDTVNILSFLCPAIEAWDETAKYAQDHPEEYCKFSTISRSQLYRDFTYCPNGVTTS